jgi:hypothetical protein
VKSIYVTEHLNERNASYSPSPERQTVCITVVLKYGDIAAFGLGGQHFDAGGTFNGHCGVS